MQGVGAPSPLVGSEQPAVAGGATATVVEAPSTGSASVLTAGTTAANPPALLAGEAMAETLRTLAGDFDYVLIDAPAALEVSDVIPLLGLVDGVLIVARVGQTREISARRLVQLLARTPSAPVLGVVANGASQQDINRFGFSAYGARSWRSRLSRL
jgi:tyrosine-protein kinase